MIAIYSNSKVFGGVEMIILRYANYLDEKNIKYVVVEESDTKLASQLSKSRIITINDFNNISKEISSIFFPNVCKLIDHDLDIDLFKHARIATWIVHPNEAFTGFFPLSDRLSFVLGYNTINLYKIIMPDMHRLVQQLYGSLVDNKSIFIMDDACKRTLKFFYEDIKLENIQILPIPVPIDDLKSDGNSNIDSNSKVLSIGYLGRMDRMKYSALKPFLLDCVDGFKSTNIELHFIGTGYYIDKLKVLCQKKGIKLYNYGYQENKIAREILYNKTNFAVAMGTSALDLASVGIPCILIDPCLSFFMSRKKQKSYKFINEVEGYTLGEYRDFPLYKESKRDLKSCIQMINYSFRDNSIKYVKENHDPDAIFDRITNDVSHNLLLIKDISSLVNKIKVKNNVFNKIKKLRSVLKKRINKL